jgi:hypothetical protein
MGRICDTVKPSRFGRYRPWILYAALPLALSAVLMFLKFPGMGEEGHTLATCVYATVTYVFFEPLSYLLVELIGVDVIHNDDIWLIIHDDIVRRAEWSWHDRVAPQR